MKTCILNSSNVFRIGHYDHADGAPILVAHLKGGTYAYVGVPVDLYHEMCAAESAGKFLNAKIKPLYGYRQATMDEIHEMLESEPTAPTAPPVDKVTVSQDVHGNVYPNFNNVGLVPVDVVILDPNVKIEYAKDGDAAFDLMAREILWDDGSDARFPVQVKPGERVMIKTGIRIALHKGMAGLVMPRSGLAWKYQVSVVNTPGLIDSGYRNEVGVLLENRGQDTFTIQQYDRIAQFGIVPFLTPIFRMVSDLGNTERGMGGFGSSGVASSEKVVV